MPALATLGPGDEPTLEAFLTRHADSSMFLRSNARAGRLADRGQPLQATYVAAVEHGGIVAVAAHCWNGMILVQAPGHLDDVVRAAAERSGHPVSGLSGPGPQVDAARKALGLEGARTAKDSREGLFALDLKDLVVPPALASGQVRCRQSRAEELELLTGWRVGFAIEALGLEDGPELRAESRADIARHHEDGSDWVLVEGERPVAYSLFNARLPDMVQVGGVWTPPELRNRGYGRSVVAGSLVAAREQGVRRSVLFADDAAAQAAYRALGFRVVGEYGLVLFAGPERLMQDRYGLAAL